ncbi:MAG TPA: NACHT domain-containing protein [Pyrinomonadaceae bacterium]|nr:NACHT domain-containing protein [Pyrinomonadaceae bacterium]
MADLFVAFGYEQPRINIHKSGRELDLDTTHRLEHRRAVAECKATADTIGGGDLNKFVGALDAEEKPDLHLTGYFISLAGFKETAIEQEKNRPKARMILVTGPEVVEELINGRILITKERATELAGRTCAAREGLTLDPQVELLAHDRGWVWAIYYLQGKARTHFALIHADGTPLARSIADEIIAADRNCNGSLSQLACLNPAPPSPASDEQQVDEALKAYGHYLAEECGYIHLDGLPADGDVGSRRLQLENLFVPLHLDLNEEVKRRPVGVVLAEHSRLAILAAPGGGKSTLLKRLAVAYADPSRRERIADDLPKRDWFPLLFRCRELLELTRGSFADLIGALSEKEPVRQHGETFRAYVDRELLQGRVLLLVDGLDEISDPGDRAAFVSMLRTSIQAYPGTALITTSREAGFRHVAAHLASVCTRATLSSFDAGDIQRLTVAWHREVVGDTEKVRADAEQLARTITANDRIQRLAINPLLLTTLLLVKRWVGSLPTRRAVLYGKAVEVLLMTWNTEGHDPIPESEALPQLCYVASAMMQEGVQKISRPRLARLLQEARDALPTELGFVEGTVEEFIHRVEDRSSLLMMTGLDVEDGRLVEFFEFRHLTFQEFLTARAMVEGWHQGRADSDTLVTVLEPHFEKEEWREVVPLAAALGGKATETLIQRLTDRLSTLADNATAKSTLALVLGSCLADEAAARPETIRAAVQEIVRELSVFSPNHNLADTLAKGRYGATLLSEARKAWTSQRPNIPRSRTLMCAVWGQALLAEDPGEFEQIAKRFLDFLSSKESLHRCEGALGFARLLSEAETDREEFQRFQNVLQRAGEAAVQLLFSNSPAEHLATAWLLYELGISNIWLPPTDPDAIGRLFELWRGDGRERIGVFGETIGAQGLMRRDSGVCSSIQPEKFQRFVERYSEMDSYAEQPAALVIAYYLETPWTQRELTELALDVDRSENKRIVSLLNRLGEGTVGR